MDDSITDSQPSDYLDLYDFRQHVARVYRERSEALQAGENPEDVLRHFRERRHDLFASHPQSALDVEQRKSFHGLPYFPYNPDAAVEATLDPNVERQRLLIQTSGEESMPMSRVALARFSFAGQDAVLSLYWIDVYGGGLFLPFRDTTAPGETYGGGRYLFDTVKGSDFRELRQAAGARRDETRGEMRRIVLDFNYAYNPSCAYNYRWSCPLAPPENHLPFPVRAGEKRPDL
jgi:uncharacterized protein